MTFDSNNYNEFAYFFTGRFECLSMFMEGRIEKWPLKVVLDKSSRFQRDDTRTDLKTKLLNKRMKFTFSNSAILLIICVSAFISFGLKNWEKRDKVIQGDTHSYYAYLPATFIYDDIKLIKSPYVFENDYSLFSPRKIPTGEKVIDKTVGVSILCAPFFFAAHGVALLSEDYSANGWSEPYKFFIVLSILFYLYIGLDFLKRILFFFGFSDIISSFTILLIGLGTSLLCYSSQTPTMEIVYSFCFVTLFIYYTILWHSKQTIATSIKLGVILGVITLIKPFNIFIILFFLCYNISSFGDLKAQLVLFKKQFYLLWLMLQISVIVWTPQFIYWQIVTGNFFYLSHIDKDYFFDFPKIITGLFSFRKGLFVYTPLLLFAIVGIFLLNNSVKKLRFSISILIVIFIVFVFFSWKKTFAPSFGQVNFIETYSLLAIPLASFLQFVFLKKIVFRLLIVFALAGCVFLNVFQTFQFENGAIHGDGMTKTLYFKQLGKLQPIPDFYEHVKSPDYEIIQSVDGALTLSLDKKKVIGRKKIALMTWDGKYLSVDSLRDNKVYAIKNAIGETENFTLVKYERDFCSLLSYENLFFSAELWNQNFIDAIQNKSSDWETFKIIEQEGKVAFKASNGKYVQINTDGSSLLSANADSLSNICLFKIIDLDN